MQGDEPNAGGDGTLGRIALKQVRVSRAEVEARNREGTGSNPTVAAAAAAAPAPRASTGSNNPMNRLVPYLDLFCRLADDELSRLARAPTSAVESLRQQIEEVNRALGRYVDLLPRLSDEELARLTGASNKTIRFWRLSQPRHLQGDSRRGAAPDAARREPSSAQSSGSMRDEELAETSNTQSLRVNTGTYNEASEPAFASDSGSFAVETEDL